MTSKKFQTCWSCGVKVEEDGMIVISGKRLGTGHYCRFCYQQNPPHPDEIIRGQIFEFVGPKPPGPKEPIRINPVGLAEENKACMDDPHNFDERISNLGAHQNSTALRQVEFEEKLQKLEQRVENCSLDNSSHEVRLKHVELILCNLRDELQKV